MKYFKKYRRTQVAELRPVTEYEIQDFKEYSEELYVPVEPAVSQINMDGSHSVKVSISQEDLQNGSPKIGDMIARNPNNHRDQWLVAEKYFHDNFEEY